MAKLSKLPLTEVNGGNIVKKLSPIKTLHIHWGKDLEMERRASSLGFGKFSYDQMISSKNFSSNLKTSANIYSPSC